MQAIITCFNYTGPWTVLAKATSMDASMPSDRAASSGRIQIATPSMRAHNGKVLANIAQHVDAGQGVGLYSSGRLVGGDSTQVNRVFRAQVGDRLGMRVRFVSPTASHPVTAVVSFFKNGAAQGSAVTTLGAQYLIVSVRGTGYAINWHSSQDYPKTYRMQLGEWSLESASADGSSYLPPSSPTVSWPQECSFRSLSDPDSAVWDTRLAVENAATAATSSEWWTTEHDDHKAPSPAAIPPVLFADVPPPPLVPASVASADSARSPAASLQPAPAGSTSCLCVGVDSVVECMQAIGGDPLTLEVWLRLPSWLTASMRAGVIAGSAGSVAIGTCNCCWSR